MNPLHPLSCVIIYGVAFLTAYLIKARYKIGYPAGRYECIDGMRGFLALGVFIYHTTIWHKYIQTGIWEAPRSHLYSQFGQTTVAIFFMITSFLFISKLLDAGKKGFSWSNFFISRIFRLVPMYYVSLLLIIISVMFITGWKLNVQMHILLKSIFNWGLFTIVEGLNINRSAYTYYVNAGVVWSLRYEWLFYFSLPLISLLILKTRPAKQYLIVGILFILYFTQRYHVSYYYILCFVGGTIAPILLKFTKINPKVKGTLAAFIVLISLFFIGRCGSANFILNPLLTTIAFTLVALGNPIFGILKNSTLKLLGEVSYSTYLLHGIVLFTAFYFGFGLENAKSLTPTEYCLVVYALTPIVVIVSFFCFKHIEKPFIDKGKMLGRKWSDKYEGNKILKTVAAQASD